MAPGRSFTERLARSLAAGVVKGVAYYLLVVYVSPLLSYYLYTAALAPLAGGAAGAPVALPLPRKAFLAAGFLFLGLSVAASALAGTLAEPLIRALSAVLGFAFLLLILWGGVLRAQTSFEDTSLSITLDLRPLAVTYFVFVTIPSVILPLVWYLVGKAHSGEMA